MSSVSLLPSLIINSVRILGTGIFLAGGDHWRLQRHAGQTFAKPTTLAHIANATLPRYLSLLFQPLDTAAQDGKVVDLEKVLYDFALAHFGHIAFDVSRGFRCKKDCRVLTHNRQTVWSSLGRSLDPLRTRIMP